MDNATLPEKFIERLQSFVPVNLLEQTLDAFSKERDVTFRANTIKLSAQELFGKLSSQGFLLEKVLWYQDAFILRNKSKEELMQTLEYIEGKLYIQSLSSMIPALVLNPQPTDMILDMAAAPGSKTSQIAALMHNQGSIIANDKSRQRLFKLRDVLQTQGATNTQSSNLPGEFLWRKYTNFFDKVLLDAPCSMEGRISLTDPDSFKDWSTKKIKQLSQLQKWLLRSAVACTKPGGIIVYSTCSLSPEENEEVINWILHKNKGIIQLEEVNLEDVSKEPGLTSWNTKEFTRPLSQTIRIYPSDSFEGFYIALLRKVT